MGTSQIHPHLCFHPSSFQVFPKQIHTCSLIEFKSPCILNKEKGSVYFLERPRCSQGFIASRVSISLPWRHVLWNQPQSIGRGEIWQEKEEVWAWDVPCSSEQWVTAVTSAGSLRQPWDVQSSSLRFWEQLFVAASLFQCWHRDALLWRRGVAWSIVSIRMSRPIWNTLDKAISEASQLVSSSAGGKQAPMGVSLLGHSWPADVKCDLFR